MAFDQIPASDNPSTNQSWDFQLFVNGTTVAINKKKQILLHQNIDYSEHIWTFSVLSKAFIIKYSLRPDV
jgi:hypothetical protein